MNDHLLWVKVATLQEAQSSHNLSSTTCRTQPSHLWTCLCRQGVLLWDSRQLSNHCEKSTRFPQFVKLQFHPHHGHSAYISAFIHSSFKIVPTFLLYMFWSGPLTSLKTINIWESLLSQCRTTVTTSLWRAGQDTTGYQLCSSWDTFTRLTFKNKFSIMRSKILIHKTLG